MTEINLTDPEITDYEIYRFDEYISDICEYLKAYKDDKIKSFQHVCDSCRNDVMIRFYPTNTGHPLRPLSEFVDHIIDQIEGYDCIAPLIGTRCIPFKPSNIIKVSLPKIGSNGTESFIYEYGDDTSPISKLVDYYGSLKQGDDKMIALVYTKIPNLGIVTSEILPYEVKYYKDADSWENVSIEFIDVFTNKKCTFEFKGDEIMGVNIKDNTSEGAAFEQALAFANKEKHKSVVRPKKVDEKCDTPECVGSTPYVRVGKDIYSLLEIKSIPDCSPSITKSKTSRPSKTDYYLGIAKAVAQRGTCLRRKFGAIIVKDDRIVSTGYVGAPRGRINCCDRGKCFRMENNIPSGTRYELCRSTHAEMNAIINASKEEMEGATMYLVGIENDGSYTKNADCCSMCKRVVINSGIEKVIIATGEGKHKCINVTEWITNDDSLTLHEGY